MKKLIVLFALALGLVGCQKPADTPNPTESSTQAESQIESQMENQAESQTDDDMISLADAVKIFTDKYPGASIAEISFERETKSAQYEIEGFDETHEYNIKISAKDGSMIKEEAEKDRTSKNKAIDLSLLSKVDELVENALLDAGQEYSLDSYSVDFEESGSYNQLDIEVKTKDGKDIEYEYNLETGELVKKDS
ncbi:PepSY domain-containing protein [Kallipyga gabonensis]|uniref:PepSY domain-containing protein n=1 Tax=Kallipyga gabonensis TaxID=1686287 RepID=UPI0006B4F1A1|nr:PepSY domain-containing protein [Kallipyga gabonensis]